MAHVEFKILSPFHVFLEHVVQNGVGVDFLMLGVAMVVNLHLGIANHFTLAIGLIQSAVQIRIYGFQQITSRLLK
jgi:hypothetical protein